MQGIKKLGVIATSLFLITGCDWFDSDNDDTNTPPTEAESSFVRVHHTSADSPNVNVLAGETALLENVPYHTSSGVLEVDAGDYDITVQGILPDESTVDAIGPASLTFAADTRYEVFSAGQLADESLEPLILSNPVSEVAAGESRIQVVHVAYGAPTVDVYLTAPDAELSSASATLTLAYGEDSGQVDVETGDYRIRLTGADVRVVHAVADAPNVDVTLNDAADPQIADLAFLSATDYLNLEAAEYSVDVAAAGGSPVVLEDIPLEVENAMSYSVYAVGELSTIGLQVLTEERRSVATEAKIQLVHAAPSAGNVDIYVTETDDISGADAAFTDIAFDAEGLVSTGNVPLTPGDYVVTVTATGTQDIAIQTPVLTLEGGGIYTAVAVDATDGGLPPQLILIDDLAN